MSFISIPPDSEEMCSICTEFLEDDVWAHLQVHRFHGRCIKEWVEKNPTCPLCRDVVDTTSLLGEKILIKKDEKTPEPDNGIAYLVAAAIVLGGGSIFYFRRENRT